MRPGQRRTNEVSDQPSCSRKRTILFAEHLTNEVLLKLPHRQFVFTKDAFASSRKAATRPIVLEGGFDEEGTFFYIPFSGLQSMTEPFRRRVIKLLVGRELLNENFARNLLSWKHSGFSIDNSVRILDESAQESLAEYIARPPRMHGRAAGCDQAG